jgi:hypothetical protein
MTMKFAALVVSVCLSPVAAYAQAPPSLTRQQRDLLQALVNAVDAAAAQPDTPEVTWQSHTMRASDGSHYVAFSMQPAAGSLPPGPVMLYLRLASVPGSGGPIERSAIREFLAGSRTDPRLLPKRGIAIGEMPVMGPTGSLGSVRQPTSTGSNEMRLMAKERENKRKEQEEREKQRRAELEGKSATVRELFPFEDFDLASNSTRHQARLITRAFTAGPGDYTLFAAWGDPSAPKPATTVKVFKRTLNFPTSSMTALAMSSVIVADDVRVREVPRPPAEQAANPYTIGATDITPAADAVFTRDERLAVAFQVINARPAETGKPDIAVTFRIVRVAGDRETPVASLNPQYYSADTLPADFDVRLGHPIFAAMSAPLTTLSRGDYRLKVQVSDRISGEVTGGDTDFRVVGTPLSLLSEAPSLAPAFRRETVLEAQTIAEIIQALTPASPSPALGRALAVATSGKFADLLVEEPVPAAESGIRTALTGLALFSIGDGSSAVQFQRALQQNAPAAPVQFLTGAARAMQSRDPDAIAAWQAALAATGAPAATSQLLAEAYLRRSEFPRAADVIAAAKNARPSVTWTRLSAAALIATRREAEAISLLESHLAANPDDQETRWLLLHARYGSLVRSASAPVATADRAVERDRFAAEARTYIDAKGANAALAAEWLKVISS